MTLVLDTGALVAYERGDMAVAETIDGAQRRRERVVTSSACVAQAWRGGGPRQALLARLLEGTEERGLDAAASRSIGALCGVARSKDVVDAHIAWLTNDGDIVLTSDVDDIKDLLHAAKINATVQRC